MTDHEQPAAGVALKLTDAQKRLLERTKNGWGPNSPTNGTAIALERRGLLEWDRSAPGPWRGRWALTEAGKAHQ